jgi:orotate phosphoribosyltransferase
MLDESVLNIMEKQLKEYINEKCIFRVDPTVQYVEDFPVGKFPGSNPKSKNSFKYMLRRLTHNPVMLNHASALIVHLIINEIKNDNIPSKFQLSGLETGSLPLIAGIQIYMYRYNIEINAFSVRKERKSSGLFHMIEGIPSNDPVLLIDDIVQSGSTLGKCTEAIEYELNLPVIEDTFSVIAFDKKRTPKNHSIFNNTDFDLILGDGIEYWLPEDCQKSENKRKDYR